MKQNKKENTNKLDTYSYKGWLISDNFFKRAFAIFGYYSVASIIIFTVFMFIIFILSIFFGILMGILSSI